MAIYRIQRIYSSSEYSSSYTSEYTNINGKESGGSESFETSKKTGHPRVTKIKKKVLVPEREFSDNREDASPELIEKAKKDGVIQKVGNSWRIVSVRKGKLWDAHYNSRENAEAALRGYQANK